MRRAPFVCRHGILIAAIALATACGREPSAPDVPEGPPPAERLAILDPVELILEATDADRSFTFMVDEAVQAALFVQFEAGPLRLDVTDSATGAAVASVHTDPVSSKPGLYATRSERFDVAPGRTYLIRLTPSGQFAGGRLRVHLYRVETLPEDRPATLLADSVATETLANSADVDVFQFAGEAGEEFLVFLEAVEPFPDNGIGLAVRGPADTALAGLRYYPPSRPTVLEAQATPRFRLATSGLHRVVVQGNWVSDGRAPAPGSGYRFLLRRVHRAPEALPATIVPGDTVAGESIEPVGDIDEFRLAADPRAEYNVFFQSLGNGAVLNLAVAFGEAGTAELVRIGSTGPAPQLLANPTGTFRAPGGPITVRVEGIPGVNRGPYRLFVYPVDRRPERAAADLVPGDSVTGEAIEVLGDIDEFQLTVTEETIANIVREPGPGSTGYLALEVVDSAGNSVLNRSPAAPAPPASGGEGTGRLRLMPGRYTVRLSGSSEHWGFSGDYRLSIHVLNDAPESAPPALDIGVTVQEPLRPLGDWDTYTLDLPPQSPVQIAVRGLAGEPGGFYVVRNQEGGAPADWVGAAFDGVERRGPAFATDRATRWEVVVRPTNGGRIAGDVGDYELTVLPVPVATEIASPELVPGTPVISETIGTADDWDEFLVHATPGSEFSLRLRDVPLELRVLDGTSLDSLASLHAGVSDRWTMPAGGEARVRIHLMANWIFSSPIGYRLELDSISRAPESVGAAAAIGDSIAGEELDREGDVDEFELAARAGDRLRLYVRLARGDIGADLRMALVETASGQVLEEAVVPYMGGGAATTGWITLPSEGPWRIRFDAVQSWAGVGAYEFQILGP